MWGPGPSYLEPDPARAQSSSTSTSGPTSHSSRTSRHTQASSGGGARRSGTPPRSQPSSMLKHSSASTSHRHSSRSERVESDVQASTTSSRSGRRRRRAGSTDASSNAGSAVVQEAANRRRQSPRDRRHRGPVEEQHFYDQRMLPRHVTVASQRGGEVPQPHEAARHLMGLTSPRATEEFSSPPPSSGASEASNSGWTHCALPRRADIRAAAGPSSRYDVVPNMVQVNQAAMRYVREHLDERAASRPLPPGSHDSGYAGDDERSEMSRRRYTYQEKGKWVDEG